MPGSDPRPPKSMGLQCTHCHYPIVKVLFAGSRKEPGRDPKTNKRPRWLHPRRKACQTVGRQYVIYYLFALLSSSDLRLAVRYRRRREGHPAVLPNC